MNLVTKKHISSHATRSQLKSVQKVMQKKIT